ncbi:MAG: MotA/TolQ/ExbB proton channel family protein [Limnochordaceae bacterium]|nr:MotA/TolQ/ExbB proton channel family protein [Limnochordaceae bacterium]
MLLASSVGGFLLALAALLASVYLEGGHAAALANLSAAVLVLGGTVGVTVMSHTWEELKRLPSLLGLAFGWGLPDLPATATRLLQMADVARRQGVLALEGDAEKTKEPFLSQATALLADGTDSDRLSASLATAMQLFRERTTASIQILQTAGGYAPTMGIIGTVLGLVHVLGNLSEPDKLGGAIATAFIATLYGVGSANIIWLPLGAKIKAASEQLYLYQRMVSDAVLAIQQGESRMRLQERLALYCGQPVAAPGEASLTDQAIEGEVKDAHQQTA